MPYNGKKQVRLHLRSDTLSDAIEYMEGKDITMSQLVDMALQFYITQLSVRSILNDQINS